MVLGLALAALGLAGDSGAQWLREYPQAWRLARQARPNTECLADSTFPDSLAHGLRLIEQLREFAHDSLGLPIPHTYSELVWLPPAEAVPLWQVSASSAYALRPYRWSGQGLPLREEQVFGHKEDAELEASKLRKQGYVVSVSPVSTWSSKSLLPYGRPHDPVLSPMLNKNDGVLMASILKEWILEALPDEHPELLVERLNLATFLAEEGAERFLAFHYGRGTYEYSRYAENRADYDRYSRHISQGALRLRSRLGELSDTLVAKDLSRQWTEELVARLDTIRFANPELYLNHFQESGLPNHDYLCTYIRWRSLQDSYKAQFYGPYHQSLRLMWKQESERFLAHPAH